MNQNDNSKISYYIDLATDIASEELFLVNNSDETADDIKERFRSKLTDKVNEETNRQNTLRQLQLAELEILRELDRVCRKHGLRYYIVGGTLIGAVRHKCFIPWDDDIDVSMPRADFDKLLEVAPSEFSDKLFLQNQKTEKGCYFYYAKLRLNGTYFGEDKFEHINMHKGIFIDVFPLDYIPSQTALQKFIFRGFSCLTGFICSKEKTSEFLYKNMSLPFIVSFRLLQCLLPKCLLKSMRKTLGKISNALSDKKLLASLSGFHGYPMEIAPTEWWGDGCDIEFEGYTFKAPSQYDTLLTHMFGDYMELPPVEARVNHTVESDKIIFCGVTDDDYKPKIKRKRSHRYYGCDYDIYPIEK